MIHVVVVGCGAMGQHHARTVARHPASRLVGVLDVHADRAEALAARWGVPALAALPDHGVDAIVVATPTRAHAAVAAPALARGWWCLVEKPLASTAADLAALQHPRCFVGHSERFNPMVRALGDARPHLLEARRCQPPGGRAVDIDVVLDLMVHDLDLALRWSGGEVAWLDAAGVCGAQGELDVASVRLRTRCGLTASLVASRVAPARERSLRLHEPARNATADLLLGTGSSTEADQAPRALTPPDDRDALQAQWHAFVARVAGQPSPVASAAEAARVVALAHQIGAIARAGGGPWRASSSP